MISYGKRTFDKELHTTEEQLYGSTWEDGKRLLTLMVPSFLRRRNSFRTFAGPECAYGLLDIIEIKKNRGDFINAKVNSINKIIDSIFRLYAYACQGTVDTVVPKPLVLHENGEAIRGFEGVMIYRHETTTAQNSN
ncbi:hypothetical protein TNCV_829001 [Trichonephila clavipes]|nr:hypothetical protein TNCV_829001 [Trichonephila clavipes]